MIQNYPLEKILQICIHAYFDKFKKTLKNQSFDFLTKKYAIYGKNDRMQIFQLKYLRYRNLPEPAIRWIPLTAPFPKNTDQTLD